MDNVGIMKKDVSQRVNLRKSLCKTYTTLDTCILVYKI